MSLTVKILGRSRIEGGGVTTAGLAVQAKEKVWGQLTGAYVTDGVPLTARDFKLGTFDFLKLDPVELINGGAAGIIEPTTATSAQYSEADSKLILQTIAANGSRTESTQTAFVVNFEVFGDGIEAPELT